MANKNAKPPDSGFKDHPERINRKGQPRKLPDLDILLAEVLGEEKDGKTALQAILMRLRATASNASNAQAIRAAELLLNRGYGLPKQKIDMSGSIEYQTTPEIEAKLDKLAETIKSFGKDESKI